MKVSVIIPVYNGATTLSACVDTILKQKDFDDYEVILVDDGSEDNTLELCHKYATSDERVRVVATNHGGAAHARNEGLSVAKGDYICFVDADDWVTENFLCSFCYEDDIECQGYNDYVPVSAKHVGIIDAFVKDDGFVDYRISLFGKIFRRSIITEKLPVKYAIGEDRMWITPLMNKSGVYITLLPFSNYTYVCNPNSLSHQRYPVELLYELLISEFNMIKALGSEIVIQKIARYWASDFFLAIHELLVGSKSTAEKCEFLSNIDSQLWQIIRDVKPLPIRYRMIRYRMLRGCESYKVAFLSFILKLIPQLS